MVATNDLVVINTGLLVFLFFGMAIVAYYVHKLYDHLAQTPVSSPAVNQTAASKNYASQGIGVDLYNYLTLYSPYKDQFYTGANILLKFLNLPWDRNTWGRWCSNTGSGFTDPDAKYLWTLLKRYAQIDPQISKKVDLYVCNMAGVGDSFQRSN